MAEKTILKWAGSKVGIMEQLRPHLPKTKRLVEPFAGSCAVMMNTDYEQYLIADINSALINMYGYAACSPKTFLKYSEIAFALNNDEESYYRLRWLFNRIWDGVPALKTSVIFLYLNRHGFRGLCRYNQDGEFNVPFGNIKKIYFPKKEIIAFSDKANRADIKCQGWAETLLQACVGDGIYCDPPYMGTGFTKYHTKGFNDGDQVALAEALQAIHATKGNPVTVSNSLAAKELYADLGFTIHEIEAPRKISVDGNRKPVTEIIATLGA
ncbi:DNA adenine methylase [Morganella morganii]|uniref:DNA adenine methylase n=1 Tax=Morganella morganii TaxID=582 RepID=UPI0034E37DBA